jgi:hypothetical protein
MRYEFGVLRPRRLSHWVVLTLGSVAAVYLLVAWLFFPGDRTPEGAYLRVVKAVTNGRAEQFFAYVETRAQHACYTIRDFRRKSLDLVLKDYPEPERSRLAAEHRTEAEAADGADVFALYARDHAWLERLRRDLSGVRRVEIKDDRATVETAHGTRYPFRRRENGIWGLTLFTAVLDAEAERAARDYSLIERSAADYRRVKGVGKPAPSH